MMIRGDPPSSTMPVGTRVRVQWGRTEDGREYPCAVLHRSLRIAKINKFSLATVVKFTPPGDKPDARGIQIEFDEHIPDPENSKKLIVGWLILISCVKYCVTLVTDPIPGTVSNRFERIQYSEAIPPRKKQRKKMGRKAGGLPEAT
jgi:hypothetical protein